MAKKNFKIIGKKGIAFFIACMMAVSTLSTVALATEGDPAATPSISTGISTESAPTQPGGGSTETPDPNPTQPGGSGSVTDSGEGGSGEGGSGSGTPITPEEITIDREENSVINVIQGDEQCTGKNYETVNVGKDGDIIDVDENGNPKPPDENHKWVLQGSNTTTERVNEKENSEEKYTGSTIETKPTDEIIGYEESKIEYGGATNVEKIPEKNTDTKYIDNPEYLVIKKGDDLYLWTKSEVTPEQQRDLVDGSKNGIQNNTIKGYFHGDVSSLSDDQWKVSADESGKVTIQFVAEADSGNNGNGNGNGNKQNNWSLIVHGDYLKEVQGAPIYGDETVKYNFYDKTQWKSYEEYIKTVNTWVLEEIPGTGGGGTTDPDPEQPGGGGTTDPDPEQPGGGGTTDPDPEQPGGGGTTDPDPEQPEIPDPEVPVGPGPGGDNGNNGGNTDIADPDVPLADVPDTDVPLTDLPGEEVPLEEIPEEEVPLEEIPEEEVPLSDIPKTGDPMTLWAALMSASGAGLAFLGFKCKKDAE